MSKRKLTREEKIAEHEYYEKICRLERWHKIDKVFASMIAEISTMAKTCTESANSYGEDEGYIARCNEERQLLNIILESISALRDSAVCEGISRYTTEKPSRPPYLP